MANRALSLYWGAAAIALSLMAPLAPQTAAWMPPCLIRSVTGWPCPTCGATHAAVALSRLDLAGALVANPLVAAAGVVFLAGGLVAGAAALLGHPFREPRLGPGARWAAIIAVATNWIWVAVR